jgi:thiamine biosynthesis lipoprotein
VDARTSWATLSLLCLALLGCDRGDQVSHWDFETMGTVGRVQIYHADRAVAAQGKRLIEGVFDSVEAVMSTWDLDSEISQLNRAASGRVLPLSPWLNECLSHAEDMRVASGGAFDPTAEPLMRLWGFYRRKGTLPSEAQIDSARALMGGYRHDRGAGSIVKGNRGTSFDLGGIAKGYALDRASEALRLLGIEDALIDLGGNLMCLGAPPGREAWRVGIRNPQNKEKLFAVLRTANCAVATSGSYERYVVIAGRRYGHIMDPSTGRPAEGLLGVTVLVPGATLADGLSTSLFVLGLDRGRKLLKESFPDAEFVFVTAPEGPRRPRVVASVSLKGRFTLLPKTEDEYEVEFL